MHQSSSIAPVQVRGRDRAQAAGNSISPHGADFDLEATPGNFMLSSPNNINLTQLYSCRYADVIVHRLLGAALALSVLPSTIKDPQALRSLADNLNTRHRNAQFAGRASVELYTLMYFKDRTILADARITKVQAYMNAK